LLAGFVACPIAIRRDEPRIRSQAVRSCFDRRAVRDDDGAATTATSAIYP